MSTNTTQQPQRHFDLHTKGFGYLNRIRKITPRKGQPFWAVEINCLHGNDGESTRFDCNVVGQEAIALFEQHLDEVKKEDKVMASVVMGDINLHSFIYTNGEKAGEKGACIKGRLLKVKYLKVNDSVVYTSEQPKTHAA